MFFRYKSRAQIIRLACRDLWQARTKLNDAERLMAQIRLEVQPILRSSEQAE